jgi:hypothetical protein
MNVLERRGVRFAKVIDTHLELSWLSALGPSDGRDVSWVDYSAIYVFCPGVGVPVSVFAHGGIVALSAPP